MRPQALCSPGAASRAALSTLVFRSPDPERLAAFYAKAIGIEFVCRQHGETPPHHEAKLGAMRFAILERDGASSVSPTFMVEALDPFVAALAAAGHPARGPILALGHGHRLSQHYDVDGNALQLFELGQWP